MIQAAQPDECRLQFTYELLDYWDPAKRSALFGDKPDASLLVVHAEDKIKGFGELGLACTLQFTSKIPIFIVTGEGGEREEGRRDNRFREKNADSWSPGGYFEKAVVSRRDQGNRIG